MDKALFTGGETVNADELKRYEIRNFSSDVTGKLSDSGWRNQLAGCVCVTLSTDNQKAEGCYLEVRGTTEEWEIKVDAHKIWSAAESDIFVMLRFPSYEIFKFSEGGLASDLVGQDQIQHGVYQVSEGRNPVPILDADLEERGIGQFCMRMTCVPSARSSARNGVILKFTLLLFPEDKERLGNTYAGATSMAWPGMRISEGEMPILPRPEAGWKCPVLPFTLPGTSFEAGGAVPSGAALRGAIAALMRKSAMPETARTGAAVVAKWKRLASKPEELLINPGPVVWPEAPPAAVESGEYTYNFLNRLLMPKWRCKKGGRGEQRGGGGNKGEMGGNM